MALQPSIGLGILAILLRVTLSQSRQEEIEYGPPCVTPNGANGFCVELLWCNSLVNLLNMAKENPDNVDYLRQSKCEGSGTNITACCPVEDLREDLDRKATKLLPSRSVCGRQWAQNVLDNSLTRLDEFPWIGQLWYSSIRKNKTATRCTGTLINPNHILTAAQCVTLYASFWKLDFVRLGEWNNSSPIDCSNEGDCADPVLDIDIAEILKHEKFVLGHHENNKNINDIALLRLSSKVTYTDFIRPICIPTSDLMDSYFDGIDLVATGWGASGDVKLKVTLIGASREYCANIYQKYVENNIDAGQLCAVGERGLGTCSGDDGVPLMGLNDTDPVKQFWYLAGMASFGTCGLEGYPGIYTRVSYYYDWILTKLQ